MTRASAARPREPDTIVGVAEVAERLNVEAATVRQWKWRDVMPAPDFELATGPVWWWSTVRGWARSTGRY